ncbi:MAG: magnesium chelatase domain-containing protein, partial [Lachnoclostridium sp.]
MCRRDVKEAGERVRTAIRNSGFDFPAKKTVINLSPANIRKGEHLIVPIALAILTSLGMVDKSKLEKAMVIGELGLDGKVRRCTGILPIVAAAKKEGCHTCIVPYENAKEAAIIEKIQIIGA